MGFIRAPGSCAWQVFEVTRQVCLICEEGPEEACEHHLYSHGY